MTSNAWTGKTAVGRPDPVAGAVAVARGARGAVEPLSPLIPDDSSRVERLTRLARGIGIEAIAFVLGTLLSPVLALLAVAVDATLWLRRRKPWMAIRLLALLWWFLAGELFVLPLLLVLWIASRGRDGVARRDRLYALKRAWVRSHLGGATRLLGLRFEVEGLELAGPGPVLLIGRHASLVDNGLPDGIVGRAHKLGLRFVIKRDMQLIPTIDIGGRWVPTLFVRRESADTTAELELLSRLTVGVSSRDALMIYPEGTRCTAEKLARAKQVIAERQPEIAPLAARLRYLLPPRLGGTLALLEWARDAHVDLVIFGHAGLDGFVHTKDLWSGEIVGNTVSVRFWRFPAAEIPGDRSELTAWLYGRWLDVDEWVGEMRARGVAALGPRAAGAEPEGDGRRRRS